MARPIAASNISGSRRLQRDLKELTQNPIPNIDARPIGDDLFKWTFTMFAADGIWAGIPFHGHMKFKHIYPAEPPEVVLKTSLDHPNVLDGWICLDMIRPPEHNAQPYQGWSSTYTLSALLQQLYGFLLLDDSIEQDYGGPASRRDYTTLNAVPTAYLKGRKSVASQAFDQMRSCSCGNTHFQGALSDSAQLAAIKILEQFCPLGPKLRTEFVLSHVSTWRTEPDIVANAHKGSKVMEQEARRAARSSRATPGSAAGSSSGSGSSSGGTATPPAAVSAVGSRASTPEQGSTSSQHSSQHSSPGAMSDASAATGSGSAAWNSTLDTDATTAAAALTMVAAAASSETGADGSGTTSPSPIHLQELDDPTLCAVLLQCAPEALWHIITPAEGRGRLARAALDCLQRQQQHCFYSKLPQHECVLGYGVARQWHHESSDIRSLSTRADYLSVDAFQAGVRRSAWNHQFDAFLPLYLNWEHGRRSLPLLPAYVAGIQQRCCSTGRLPGEDAAQQLEPRALLRVLAQLLNSLVVELVDIGEKGKRQQQGQQKEAVVGQQMSDAALQTFCHLHHLLLAAALQPGSTLLQAAQQDVAAFMAQRTARHKRACPDLGVLLVQLLLVPKEAVPWSRLAPVLLRELLARQVRWIIQEQGKAFGTPHKEQAAASGDGSSWDDYQRLKRHFESGGTGLRNVMLQAWFANALARPAKVATWRAELADIKGAYDASSGMPPLRLFQAFNAQARAVNQAGSWCDVLSVLRLGLSSQLGPPQGVWVKVLRQAVVDSFRAGYHRRPDLGPPRAVRDLLDWGRCQPLGVVSTSWV